MNNKNVSGLKDHFLNKKKGVVQTPINSFLKDQLQLASWSKERMPEYLWLGLIYLSLSRNEAFEIIGQILFDISEIFKSMSLPRFSTILKLTSDEQYILFKLILKRVDKEILSPLTIIYRSKDHPVFNDLFYSSEKSFEYRLKTLSNAMKIFYPHQSNEATDLRYLSLSLMIFGGRIHISVDCEISAQAFKEYPYTDHSDEKMHKYRPTIRSFEGMNMLEPIDIVYINKFWKEISMITPCNPFVVNFDEDKFDYKLILENYWKIVEYIINDNMDKSINDNKFDVMIGSVCYSLKIFQEISDKDLGNSILSRHGIRTIIEIYIIMKYLLKNESVKPAIWQEYKIYGISKLKLILLKARDATVDHTSHFKIPIIDVLVNEIKWEEFIDIDLKYFDKQSIREKSNEVGEKELYDLYYDYDSNFSHGLWGAIRESSFLHCNNPCHQYHSIPDISLAQHLPDVRRDCMVVMDKIICLLKSIYYIPEALHSKSGDMK